MKILIIDDSEIKSNNIKATILKLFPDADIHQIDNANEGLRYLGRVYVDYAFIDMQMPLFSEGRIDRNAGIYVLYMLEEKGSLNQNIKYGICSSSMDSKEVMVNGGYKNIPFIHADSRYDLTNEFREFLTPPVDETISLSSSDSKEIMINEGSPHTSTHNFDNVNFDNSYDVSEEPSLHKGRLICLEGIDGTGKTTLGKRLATKLDGVYKFLPSDNKIGTLFREYLHDSPIEDPVIREKFMGSLIIADRYVSVFGKGGVIETLESGKDVVLDRYTWSNLAYNANGATYKERVAHLNEINNTTVKDFPKPDLVIYLDLSVEDSLKRLGKIDKAKDIYENHEALS